jgi:triosephosphate isomerase
MRAGFVAGNWKMHGSLRANAALLEALKAGRKQSDEVTCAVCVPFPYLAQVSTALAGSSIAWGAQNLSEHDAGAYTGEVSGAMLREFGCRYVIVGHSERRALYAEDDQRVAAKFVAARRAGLTPILCVGETLEQRERDESQGVVARQLDAVVAAAGVAGLADAVLAYEPVWAIGTGKTATPAQAQQVHRTIRDQLAKLAEQATADRVRILYGGSVKPDNIDTLMAEPDVDGALVGGASLVAEQFIRIVQFEEQ